jgi:hypothetical protein
MFIVSKMKRNRTPQHKGGNEMNEAVELTKRLMKKTGIYWRQFNKCEAYLSEILEDDYRLIKSYNTIVGLVDIKEGKYYQFGHFSKTTSVQLTRIYNTFYRGWERIIMEEKVDDRF